MIHPGQGDQRGGGRPPGAATLAEQRQAGGSQRWIYAPTKQRARRLVRLLADYRYLLLHHFGEEGVETIKGISARPRPGKGMVAMTQGSPRPAFSLLIAL
jgi:hypothetical protein